MTQFRGVSRNFSRGVFGIFLYGRENLGVFWIFFLKNHKKLKKIPKKGFFTPKTPPCTPDTYISRKDENFLLKFILKAIHSFQIIPST